MNVRFEIFVVAAAEGNIRYRRSVVDATGREKDPDEVVAEHLARNEPGCKARFVHSTSWRYEEDGVLILTYLVLVAALPPNLAGQEGFLNALPSDLPVGRSPTAPKPEAIREEHVLAHGLRHLALLEQEKGALTDHAGPHFAGALRSLAPVPAGRIR